MIRNSFRLLTLPEKIAGPSEACSRNLRDRFSFRVRRSECSTPDATLCSNISRPSLDQHQPSPSTASIQVGEEQTFIAKGLDQYNHPMTGVTFAWTSSDDGAGDNAIAMFHGGVATGVSAGVMHVTASASGVTSASAALTVLAPPPAPATILVTPAHRQSLLGNPAVPAP